MIKRYFLIEYETIPIMLNFEIPFNFLLFFWHQVVAFVLTPQNLLCQNHSLLANRSYIFYTFTITYLVYNGYFILMNPINIINVYIYVLFVNE